MHTLAAGSSLASSHVAETLFFFFLNSDCLRSVLEVHAETITTRKISQDLFYALWLPAPASTRCSLDALVGELGFLLRRYGHSWSRSSFSTRRPPSGTGGVRGLCHIGNECRRNNGYVPSSSSYHPGHFWHFSSSSVVSPLPE